MQIREEEENYFRINILNVTDLQLLGHSPEIPDCSIIENILCLSIY